MKKLLTKEFVLNKISALQLAFNKIDNKKSIELIAFIKISSNNTEYWVMERGEAIIKTFIIDEAIFVYNSLLDFC